MEKLKSLKETSPVLFYLIMALLTLPIIGLVFVSIISPAIRSWLVSSATKLMESSKAKSDKIDSEIAQTQKEIDTLDKVDQNLKEQIESVSKSDDADWHKKMGKK